MTIHRARIGCSVPARVTAVRSSDLRQREAPVYPKLGVGRAKAERQVNMALHLKAAGDPGIKPGVIAQVPRYDDTQSPDAIEKRWDRDKADIRCVGLSVNWNSDKRYEGEGYTIKVGPLPIPTGPVRRAFERYFHIIWCCEQGYNPTVPQLAEYLGVDEVTILEDIACLSMCCCGRAPHEYLDSRVEDGVVVITGPRLFT